MSATTIVIKDDGLDKQFTIKKFKPMGFLLFTNLALGLLSKSDNDLQIKQLVNQLLQTGQGVRANDGQMVEDISSIKNDDLVSLIFNALKSAIASLDEAKSTALVDKLLACVTYHNGAFPEQLSVSNIDTYLADGANLYKLIWKVVVLNYSFLLGAKAQNSVKSSEMHA